MNTLDINISNSECDTDINSDYDGQDNSNNDNDDDVSLSSASSSTGSSSSTNSVDNFDYNAMIEKAQDKTANKITTITSKAKDLVDQYTLKNTEDFLADPLKAFDEVDLVCDEMKGAWEEFRSELADIEREKEAHEEKIDSKFRKVFINLMTETFADELDDLRHGRVRVDTRKKDKKQMPGENIPDILMQENIVMPVQCMNENVGEDVNVDVKVLVDMLESGMDGWNASEKELFLQDWKNKSRKHHDDKEEEDQQVMTPHERRKREIFGDNVK